MYRLVYISLPLGFLLLAGMALAPEQQRRQDRGLRNLSTGLNTPEPSWDAGLWFATEQVPIQRSAVKAKLQAEIDRLTRAPYGTQLILRRSLRYQELFREILHQEGVPEDFYYMAIAESGLSNAISPANAQGFWQFMKATARAYDLEVSATVDERFHPEKSTVAACQMLRENYELLGDWTLVAAAYNMGPGGLRKAMRSQGSRDFYSLDLNKETARYLYRIMSYKVVMEQAEFYRMETKPLEGYDPLRYAPIFVSHDIPNLARFAAANGTSLAALKLMNPWLISDRLIVRKGKTYEIRIPVSEDLQAEELAIRSYKRPEVSNSTETIPTASITPTDSTTITGPQADAAADV